MTHIREVMTVQIAPSGKQVAYTVSLPRRVYIDPAGENYRELYLLDRRGKNSAIMSGRVSVGRLRWLNNATLIFHARRAADENTSLFTYKTDTRSLETVIQTGEDIQSFDVSESGKQVVFWTQVADSSQQKQLNALGFNAIVHEVEDPKQRLYIGSLSDAGWQTHEIPFQGHVIDAQVFNDGQRILLVWSEDAITESQLLDKRISVINLQGQEQKRLSHTGKLGRVLLSADEKNIAMIGTNDIVDPKQGRLLVANLDDDILTELVTDFKGHVRDIAWLTNNRIGFVAHLGVKSLVASKSISRPGPRYRLINKNAGIVERMSAAKGRQDLAYVMHGPTHPRELFWQRADDIARATVSNPWLAEVELAEQDVHRFTAKDGLKLEGIYVAPLAQTDQPPPLIIFVHGGPEAHVSDGWLHKYSQPVHYAASLGFASFLPNYRGSTGRGVAFSQAGQGDFAGAEFNDLLAARDYLIEQKLADPQKVAITGVSYGGYAAAWAATRFSSEFAASVSGMGISNQVSKFGTSDIPNEIVYQHALQWPWQDWLWWLSRSPVFHAANSNTPLLLMHGMRDERVHYSQSLEMYRYLKMQSGTPVRLVLYPKGGHGFNRVSDQLDYAKRLMRWMSHFVLRQNTDLPPLDIGHEARLEHWQSQLQQSLAEGDPVASPD